MRETITLAQPPCEERQRVAGKHLGRKKERKERATVWKKGKCTKDRYDDAKKAK